MYYFFNNKILNSNEPSLLPNDLGLLRGYAVFDYLRTYNGNPFLLNDYLLRFNSSANALGLSIPLSNEKIKKVINDLLIKNNCKEAGVRLLLTGGYSEDSMTSVNSNFIILIENLQQYPETHYSQGIKLISHEHLRQFPLVKTTNYITAVKLMPEVKKQGASEILYYFNDKILEASRSNFFIVKNNTIITPKEDILLGITRKAVINLANKNYKILEQNISWSDLENADEAFITGTTKKVMPVVKVDNMVIGNGKPGPVSLSLLEAFTQYTDNC